MGYQTVAAKNPPEYADVREMRLRGDDMTNMLRVFAAENGLAVAARDPRTRERMALVKNGWRDFRLAQGALDRIVRAVQWTIPMEKRVGFSRVAGRCRYIVMQGPLASRPKPDQEEVLTTDELEILVRFAWDGNCKMCIDGQCAQCELGKVLDNVLVKDRDGGCWGSMDITRGEGEAEKESGPA